MAAMVSAVGWWLWWITNPPFPPPWFGTPGVPMDRNSSAPPVITEWLN
jgi:hypothetical protein